MARRIERPPLTAGDKSPRAATSGRSLVQAAEIEQATAQHWRPDVPAGDTIQDVLVGGPTSGTVEHVVDPIERTDNAARVYKLSPELSPIIDAITTNVHGAGFTIEPVLDIDDPHTPERIRDLLAYEGALKQGDFEADVEISDEVVEDYYKSYARRVKNETFFLESWFARCCPDMTYRQMLILLGQDVEYLGYGGLEVTRDERGLPARLIWVPGWSLRAKPLSEDLITTEEPVPVTLLLWSMDTVTRRYRGFLQIDGNNTIVARYKEYGDPRVLSRDTGIYYSSLEEMLATREEWGVDANGEPIAPSPATEILFFTNPCAISSTYGKPAWSGVYPNLIGARDLEEFNHSLVTDQKVPQMLILVAGGAGVPQKELEKLAKQIELNAKAGKRGIYVLQARSAKTAAGTYSATPTMEVVKTKSEQHEDALGLKYLAHSDSRARGAWRFPRAALGIDEGMDTDKGPAGIRFAESQIYDPRRDALADRLNSTIVRDLGMRVTRYHVRSRTPKEPNELAMIAERLANAGGLTPDDVRKIAKSILNMDLKDMAGIWSKLPGKLLTALLQTKNQLVASAILASERGDDFMGNLQDALREQAGMPDPGRAPRTRANELAEETAQGTPPESEEAEEAEEPVQGE